MTTPFRILYLAAALVACAIYLPVFGYPAIFDDAVLIREPSLAGWGSLASGDAFEAFALGPSLFWRPIASASIAAGNAFDDPLFANRTINCALLFVWCLTVPAVVRALDRLSCGASLRLRSDEGAVFFGSMFALFHPALLEGFGWVASRGDLLVALAFSATVVLSSSLFGSNSPLASTVRGRLFSADGTRAAALFACVLAAALSKETGLVAVAAFAAALAFAGRRRESAYLAAALAFAAAVSALGRHAFLGSTPPRVGDFAESLWIFDSALFEYWLSAFFPWRFHAQIHAVDAALPPLFLSAAAALALALLAPLLLFAARAGRSLSAPWAAGCFGLYCSAVAALQAYSGHAVDAGAIERFYIPLLPLLGFAACKLFAAVESWRRPAASPASRSGIAWGAAVAAAGALASSLSLGALSSEAASNAALWLRAPGSSRALAFRCQDELKGFRLAEPHAVLAAARPTVLGSMQSANPSAVRYHLAYWEACSAQFLSGPELLAQALSLPFPSANPISSYWASLLRARGGDCSALDGAGPWRRFAESAKNEPKWRGLVSAYDAQLAAAESECSRLADAQSASGSAAAPRAEALPGPAALAAKPRKDLP